MKLTRKRKIYLGVLGMASVALIVDATVLRADASAPTQAGAASAASVQPVAATSPPSSTSPAPVGTAPDLTRRLGLARNLIGPMHEYSDPFVTAVVETWPQRVLEHALPRSPDDWRVTTIIDGSSSQIAILNGRTMRVGDQRAVEGSSDVAELTRIGQDAVVVRFGAREFRIQVPMPGLSATGSGGL